jgi:hypothetical protein
MRTTRCTGGPGRGLAIALAALLAIGAMLGPGMAPAAARQATPASEVNVELILDSSGSMAEEIVPGQTRIDAARDVLGEVIDELPEQDGINVGFRVYGHKGNNTEAGKAVSCRSTELKVPIDGVDKDALRAQVDAYSPVGWTPIALSLQAAGDDFPVAADGVRNAVVLVTDGLETCGGNPCTASRMLVRGDGKVVTHVIGFALSDEERANLQCIVDESGGLLLSAANAGELSTALFTVLEELEVVVLSGQLEIEEIGGLFPQATITGGGAANDSNPNAQGVSLTLTDSNIVEVPAGSYVVSWQNPSGSTTTVVAVVEAGQKTVIRGSIFVFPQGGGQVFTLTAQDGTVIWQAAMETGDRVWVLPGIYRLEPMDITADLVIVSLDVQTLPGSTTQVQALVSP